MKTEILHLCSVEFNMARILESLAVKVKSLGAIVKPCCFEYNILDKNADDGIIIHVEHKNYVSFVLNNTYYHYTVFENPLFDFYFYKIQVENDKYSRNNYKYSRNNYSQVSKKEWLFNDLFFSNCNQELIDSAANIILNELLNADFSKHYIEHQTISVPNTYNDGFHTKMERAPEKFEKLDWLLYVAI